MARVTITTNVENNAHTRRSILVLGEPGVGKTRFAGTFPSPLFLDFENGAATAVSGGGHSVISIATEKSTLTTTRDVVAAIKSGSFDSESRLVTFEYGGHQFVCGTVVIDAIDDIQLACKLYEVLNGRPHMERDDWDTILNLMSPLMLDLNALPVNVIVIAHTKRVESYVDKKTGRRYPAEQGLAMQGAIKNQLPGWFDIVVHIIADGNGNRYLVTGPKTFRGYRLLAATDRHGLVSGTLDENGLVPLPADENGYPDPAVAMAICR